MRNLLLAPVFGVQLLLSGLAPKMVAAPPPLTRRQHEDRLANRLESALSYGDWRMWDKVAEECHDAGRGDLLGRMRGKWPHWAEMMDRNRARELGE
jgi:hypothetical protein